MAVRIEDAGFEIRDMIAWVYGSGFPKSLDVSKAIDKAAGAEREVIGPATVGGKGQGNAYGTITRPPATAPATAWQGWGTALKPALEPITVARKPLIGTVAENVLAHGTGALNVDGCRVGNEVRYNAPAGNKAGGNSLNMSAVGMPQDAKGSTAAGRWPANLIHDGCDEVVGLLNDAARFFYCAKASKADRGEGNNHPTVKPTDLMRYLCRLVTPPGGTVLDPFMGSGSTGKAAMLEGFGFIGIERDPEYVKIAKARIGAARRLL
jgi:site-specific DNA-methyltransferase (adenine-specific)